MSEYRWNQQTVAAGYDAAAPLIHPYYVEVQDAVMEALRSAPAPLRVVDAGGGSGRLLERIMDRFPDAHVALIDQSGPFLELAAARLARFGGRVRLQQARLQDQWPPLFDGPPTAIVSTSAVHHLDSQEKRDFYRRCWQLLAAGGVVINGDEVRDPDDAVYRADLAKWALQMRHLADTGRIPAAMSDVLLEWRERNLGTPHGQRVSGDDCHETVAAQLDALRAAGFEQVRTVWRREMWAVMVGIKPTRERTES